MNLGNHWLLRNSASVIVHDDGRSRLPGTLRPGERATLSLSAKAPAEPGDYDIEFDVVQEACRWFNDVGSPTLRVPVSVIGRSGTLPAETAAPPGEAVSFMMEGIPRKEVVSLISAAGARLIATDEHITEWYSYGYYILR